MRSRPVSLPFLVNTVASLSLTVAAGLSSAHVAAAGQTSADAIGQITHRLESRVAAHQMPASAAVEQEMVLGHTYHLTPTQIAKISRSERNIGLEWRAQQRQNFLAAYFKMDWARQLGARKKQEALKRNAGSLPAGVAVK